MTLKEIKNASNTALKKRRKYLLNHYFGLMAQNEFEAIEKERLKRKIANTIN